MKGIYLTEAAKKETEAEIEKLKSNHLGFNYTVERQNFLEEILSSAIIIPVEENWNTVEKQTNMMENHQLEFIYPNGVIIQPNKIK